MLEPEHTNLTKPEADALRTLSLLKSIPRAGHQGMPLENLERYGLAELTEENDYILTKRGELVRDVVGQLTV